VPAIAAMAEASGQECVKVRSWRGSHTLNTVVNNACGSKAHRPLLAQALDLMLKNFLKLSYFYGFRTCREPII
jgi:hypothetical protein